MISRPTTYPLRYTTAWLAAGYTMLIAVVVASLLPGLPDPGISGFDKLAHFGMYLVVILWFEGIYRPGSHKWLVFLLLLLGVVVELAQEYSGLRNGDWRDLVANLAGLVTGLLLARAGLSGWCLAAEEMLLGKQG